MIEQQYDAFAARSEPDVLAFAKIAFELDALCIHRDAVRSRPEFQTLPPYWQTIVEARLEFSESTLANLVAEESIDRSQADAIIAAIRQVEVEFDQPPPVFRVTTADVDGAEDEEDDGPPPPHWPEPLDKAAFHGLAGEFVRIVEPQTEADPAALLVQCLVAFGSIVGRNAYVPVESDRHYANEFMCLVGESARARKGTSFGRVKHLFKSIDESFAARLASGLSSGEGLIHAVRDPVVESQPIKKNGVVESYQDVTTDPGVVDKRLLVVESEFGRVLKVMGREGNTLSAVLREVWDQGNACVLTKSKYKATDAM